MKKVHSNLEEFYDLSFITTDKKVGQGSFSEVFSAFEKKWQVNRAIKVTVCNDQVSLNRQIKEIGILSQLVNLNL